MGWFDAVTTAGGGANFEQHYEKYKAKLPVGNRITVCSAYGCKVQQKYVITDDDDTKIHGLVNNVHDEATEREAILDVIQYLESKVGPATKTALDRAGIDLGGNNDPTQMDCVDEATNATSYILWMIRQGYVKYHIIMEPAARWSFTRYTHYNAVIKDRSGKRWAIDTGVGPNGARGKIVEFDKWYN